MPGSAHPRAPHGQGIPALIADNGMRRRDERFAEQGKHKGPAGKTPARAPQTGALTRATRSGFNSRQQRRRNRTMNGKSTRPRFDIAPRVEKRVIAQSL